jgi:hypothetical protein
MPAGSDSVVPSPIDRSKRPHCQLTLLEKKDTACTLFALPPFYRWLPPTRRDSRLRAIRCLQTRAARIKSFDTSAIDKTADPCTDFYQYACGNWVKDNPIPSDQVRWARSFSLLGERNRYLLWQELDAAAKDAKTPLEKKYGDYFAACMNTDLIEKKGLEPLDPASSRSPPQGSQAARHPHRRPGSGGRARPPVPLRRAAG